MSNIAYLEQHQHGQDLVELRNFKAIKAVADLDASKLVLTNGSKDLVSSSIGEDDLVTAESTNTLTNKTFDANGAGNSISNLEVADFASGVVLTDLSTEPADDSTLASALAIYNEIQAAVADITPVINWQADVLDVQVDATLNPGATPATGDRYILTNVAALHANFGTITGVANNDIVQYDGAEFVVAFDASTGGEGVFTWSAEDNKLFQFDGSTWVNRDSLFTYTASSGITLDGQNFQIDADAITSTMLAGSIPDSKLDQITTSDKVAGSAVQLASNGGLEDSTGLKIKPDVTTGATVLPIALGANGAGIAIDNLTLENGEGTLKVKAGGISDEELASDSVTTDKILDENVTFGKLAADAKAAVGTFNSTTSWSSSVLTITAATHGLGTNVTATIDKLVTGAVAGTYFPQIASNGDISFEVVAGLEFAGRYTVKKRA